MSTAVNRVEDTVSVIVPVYNVAPYLRCCLDSILSQTYPHLEIIIVDDGSSDGSGMICDEYARKDARVRVLHQSNAGLAAARNSGLDVVSGAYVGFVDSDDTVLPEMYETLLRTLKETGADMAQCGVWVDAPDMNSCPPPTHTTCTGEDFLRLGLEGRVPTTMWCHLYAASLWRGLRFVPGYYYEDEMLFPELAIRSRLVARLSRKLYVYIRRESGILRMPKTMMHLRSKETVFKVLLDFFAKYTVQPELAAFCLCRLLPSYRQRVKTNAAISRDEAQAHNKRMHAIFRDHFPAARRYPLYAGLPLFKRTYWWLHGYTPTLAGFAVDLAKGLASVIRRASLLTKS